MNYTAADGAKLLGTKMKRFVEFDVLRGILLLLMSVDHSPSSLRRFTDQPLGFFSTAECFVFVSAFLAGMLFRKRAEKLGFAAARASSIHRDGRIYRAHLVTLAFAFVLGSFFLSDLPGIKNMLDRYLVGSLGGDRWITGAAFPSALDGHPPDVRPLLFSHTCRLRGSSTMGMEDGPFCQLFGLDHRTDTSRGSSRNCIQRSIVYPTRSIRSSRLAASLGRRAIHWSAFPGKQGPPS